MREHGIRQICTRNTLFINSRFWTSLIRFRPSREQLAPEPKDVGRGDG
jgi:hypothetical protein